MKRLYFFVMVILLMVGCSKSETDSAVTQLKLYSPKFYAEFGDDTRTYVDDQLHQRWHKGDQISVFTSTQNQKYQFDGETGDNSGTFSVIASDQTPSGNALSVNANFAVYPYSEKTTISPDGTLSLDIPSTQSYAENSFAVGSNPMIAVTNGREDTNFQFKNLCGYLRLRLYGNDIQVKTIQLRGNKGEKIAGEVNVKVLEDSPTITMSDEATEIISLDCSYGLTLGSAEELSTDFWFVIPPITFEEGFSVTITDVSGGIMTKSTTGKFSIERNVLKSMTAFKVETSAKDLIAAERAALIAFYEATGGDNWTNNTNWCSDKPVSEWYGVSTNELGLVINIFLSNNNLVGYLPNNIGNLSNVQWLSLSSNKLSYKIPDSIGNLHSLINLNLSNNRLYGSIPESICNLTKLTNLHLSDNRLSGTLPSNIGNMESLEWIDFGSSSIGAEGGDIEIEFDGNGDIIVPPSNTINQISGNIPESIEKLKNLKIFSAVCNDLSGNIPDGLWSIPTIESVQLSGNHLTGELNSSIGNAKKLKQLWLSNNCLTGKIPNELYELENLEELFLGNVSAVMGVKEFDGSQINKLTGQLSSNISKLSKLRQFDVICLQLTGKIPDALWDIQTLEWAELGGNFFEGELSPAIGNAKNLTILSLGNNHLSGAIPKEIGELSKLDQFIIGNAYSTMGIEIEFDPNTQFNVISGDIPKEISNLTNLSYFSVMDNNITGEFPEFFAYNPRMQGSVPILSGNRMSGTISKEVLMSENWKSWVSPELYILNQQDGYGFTLDYGELYESTDYSKDGEVKQLQAATKGDGIDIVLMGDAYSDRLIADGTYDQTMQTAMEKFFEEEPYKSFRDHFNVYSVTAVSKNEVYTNTSETTFAGYFGGGTLVGGNDQRAFYYAQQAIGEERMDEALIVVMMNSAAYAGTCYMYNPTIGDYGDGVSVSYFPVGEDTESLGRLIHHEAAGHGFSKLGDEYAYENMGAIPESEITSARAMAEYGWWKNIDFTNDPTKVKWNHFLTDSRYTNDGLGVYEGAFTYWTGAYRPTQNSIMNANVGGFNAPSRESIYYRIHKLAYGEEWEYDYEEFVEWDAKNRTTAATTRGIPYRLDIPEDFQPTHPPVVVKSSWRNAKNNAPKKAATSNGGNAGGNLRPATSNRTNQQTMSISPNRTVSSSGMVVTIDSTTGRKTIERMEIK